mmetsp:Transcript_21906/g.52124  ORF Transcript_21906/g.52124 Transcript_21906/m.52124 type:complete len:117 (+) Transcript_21906:722-1072(+)
MRLYVFSSKTPFRSSTVVAKDTEHGLDGGSRKFSAKRKTIRQEEEDHPIFSRVRGICSTRGDTRCGKFRGTFHVTKISLHVEAIISESCDRAYFTQLHTRIFYAITRSLMTKSRWK